MFDYSRGIANEDEGNTDLEQRGSHASVFGNRGRAGGRRPALARFGKPPE